jgi:hypothetical protein
MSFPDYDPVLLTHRLRSIFLDPEAIAFVGEYGLPTIVVDRRTFRSDTFRHVMKAVMDRRCANCGKRLHDGYEMFQQRMCEPCYHEAAEEYMEWSYQQDLEFERRQRLVRGEV